MAVARPATIVEKKSNGARIYPYSLFYFLEELAEFAFGDLGEAKKNTNNTLVNAFSVSYDNRFTDILIVKINRINDG